MKIVDLSQKILHNAKAYPGDTIGAKICRMADLKTDGYNRSRLDLLDLHYGTHIDMPSHFIRNGRTVSSLICVCGDATLFRVTKSMIGLDDINANQIETGNIVLIHTGWDKKLNTKEYFSDYPYLAQELAEVFVERKIKCLGIDTPSPDSSATENFEVHRILLKSGIPIIEGMTNLEKAHGSKKRLFFIAMPLNIVGAEASPVRAVVVLYDKGELVWPSQWKGT